MGKKPRKRKAESSVIMNPVPALQTPQPASAPPGRSGTSGGEARAKSRSPAWLPGLKDLLLVIVGVVLGLVGQAIWESRNSPNLLAFEAAGTIRSQTFPEDTNLTRISYLQDEYKNCATLAFGLTVSKENAIAAPDSVVFLKKLGIGNKGRGVAKAVRVHVIVTGPAGADFRITGGSRLTTERLSQSGSTSTYLLEVDRVLNGSFVVVTAVVPIADHPLELQRDPVLFRFLGSEEGKKLSERDTFPMGEAIVAEQRLDETGPREMVFGGLDSRSPYQQPVSGFITKSSMVAHRNIELCVEQTVTPASINDWLPGRKPRS